MMLINDILERIKDHIKAKSDAAVTRALKVSPQRLRGWRKRGTIPWEELCTFLERARDFLPLNIYEE